MRNKVQSRAHIAHIAYITYKFCCVRYLIPNHLIPFNIALNPGMRGSHLDLARTRFSDCRCVLSVLMFSVLSVQCAVASRWSVRVTMFGSFWWWLQLVIMYSRDWYYIKKEVCVCVCVCVCVLYHHSPTISQRTAHTCRCCFLLTYLYHLGPT